MTDTFSDIRISARLTGEDARRFQELLERSGGSISDLLRAALREYHTARQRPRHDPLRALAGYIGERFGEQRRRGPALAPGLAAITGNIHFYFARRGGAWTATRALLVMMTEACMAPNAALQREVAAYNRSALAWFEQHIRTGIDGGEIDAGNDPAVTAVILLGAMRGVMLQWLVDDRIRLAAVRDRLLQIVQQVLRPPP